MPTTILAIYAHPDDPEISCGGKLIKSAKEGARIVLAIFTNGEKGSQDSTADLKKIVETRKQETKNSASFMSISDVIYLDYPDGELVDNRETRGRIAELIRIHKPDLVVAPDPTRVFLDNYINHSDHRTTGWIVINSILPAGNWQFFREQLKGGLEPHCIKELYLSSPLEPNWGEDISDYLEDKLKALFYHESQFAPNAPPTKERFREFLTKRAETVGKKYGFKYAEEFRKFVFE